MLSLAEFGKRHLALRQENLGGFTWQSASAQGKEDFE
jgi:hypothetical protein